MKQNLWLTMVTCLAYCLDKEFWKAIEYLKEQVKVLIGLYREGFDLHAALMVSWVSGHGWVA